MNAELDRRRVGEVLYDGVHSGISFLVISGVSLSRFLKRENQASRYIGYRPEERDFDSLNIYSTAMRLFGYTSIPGQADARYTRQTNTLPNAGVIKIRKSGLEVVDTSIEFLPTVTAPAQPSNSKTPAIPKAVNRTTTTLRFNVPENWREFNETSFYETTADSVLSRFPTTGVSSWEELGQLIDNGEIEPTHTEPNWMPRPIDRRQAEDFHKTLQSARPTQSI